MERTFIKLILTGMVFLAPTVGFAETVTVTVKGMVCSFCAQGLKKTFGKIEDVEKIEVDLENKFVKLDIKNGSTLSDEKIESTIKDSGFDVLKIEREKNA